MDELGRKYLKKKNSDWLKNFMDNNKAAIKNYGLKLKN